METAQQLSPIPETMLIPLWARAVELERPEPIIQDPKAAQILSGIDYDFNKFKKSWLSQVGVSIRTAVLDRATRRFLDENPGAVVVNLGAGLDTRLERLPGNHLHCWYDLDVPEAIDMRRRFFKENEKNRFIAKSVFDYDWFQEIDHAGRSLLFIAEGMLMYFPEEEIRPLFRRLGGSFSGAEILFEVICPFMVGKGRHHDSLKSIDGDIDFRWGLKEPKEMESWNSGLKYLEEWNLYDYHRARWKWFRYLAMLPLVRANMSSRIIRMSFE